MSLFDKLEDLDRSTSTGSRDEIVRAPFPYPGGKSRSIKEITSVLPYRNKYVEVFGGSGAVLLARHNSKLDVFNDRFAGVVAFYRCLRDPEKFKRMCEWLRLSVHSREDFVWMKATWENCHDDVERACRWYSMVCYSFGGLGRNWGRSTSGAGTLSGKVINKIPHLEQVHKRFRNVQVENLDWERCIKDYDDYDTVFYLDPPYVDSSEGVYRHELTRQQHRDMLDVVFDCKGYVAVSAYQNDLYDQFGWDHVHTWDAFVSIQSLSSVEGNKKEHLAHVAKRSTAKEALYIKE